MRQRTKFKITVYTLLFIIACLTLFLCSNSLKTKARDYKRIGDLKTIQSKFAYYFSKNNTYIIPSCGENDLLSDCKAPEADFSNLTDPLNQGMYRYVIFSLSETDFQIGFALEKKLNGVEAGGHIYSKNGLLK